MEFLKRMTKLPVEQFLSQFGKTILVLGLSLAYFIWLAAPDITWINTDSDSTIYIWSTTHWGLSHPTGAPLYNIIGNILNQGATVQEAAQHLALLSAICASITTLIIFLETRNFIGPGIFLASGLVVSQSTIIETYAPVTMFIALSWYWRKNKYLFPISVALGLGIHHLIGISMVLMVFFRYRYLNRKLLKTDLLIIPLGFLFYIYLPFAVQPPASWSVISWSNYLFGQNFLTGGLDPIASGPQRLRDFALVFFGGLGITSIFLFKIRDVALISLILVFIIYYVTNLAPQTYVYLYPSFFFVAVAMGQIKFGKTTHLVLAINISLLIIFNLFWYDIGRNLDPSPTSARMYLSELQQLPNNSIIYADRRGWEYALQWYIPAENNIKVYTKLPEFEQAMEENPNANTYRSILVDSTRYYSVITPCTIKSGC